MPTYLALQTLAISYSVGSAPFKRWKDNAIDGVNETTLFIMITFMTMYYREDQWDTTKESIFVLLAISNVIALFFINFAGTAAEVQDVMRKLNDKANKGEKKKKRHSAQDSAMEQKKQMELLRELNMSAQ